MGRTISPGPLDIVGLTTLMGISAGASNVAVALIDGPVAANHADLATENIHSLTAAASPATPKNGVALSHGTYVAGILAARRGSSAPAICPDDRASREIQICQSIKVFGQALSSTSRC